MKRRLLVLFLSGFMVAVFGSVGFADTLVLQKGNPVRITIDNSYSKAFTFNYTATGKGTVLLRMIEKIGGGFLGKLKRYHQIDGNTSITERLQSGVYIAELTYQTGDDSSIKVSGNLKLRPIQ